MKRRGFITLLGGAATWPLAARAQQLTRTVRVGVLMGSTESDPISSTRIALFKKRLQELGWIEGHNLHLDVFWGGSQPLAAHGLSVRVRL